MSTQKTESRATINISSQTLNDYDHLKHVLTQITGREDLNDDEVIKALIDWFMHSYVHGQQPGVISQGHNHNNHNCCGWWQQWQCASHSEEKKAKGQCCGWGCC